MCDSFGVENAGGLSPSLILDRFVEDMLDDARNGGKGQWVLKTAPVLPVKFWWVSLSFLVNELEKVTRS